MRIVKAIQTGTKPSLSSPAPAMAEPHSPWWHSPVPYLFGGLAAILGLIAFALLILGCSYFRLCGLLDTTTGEGADVESGQKDGDSSEQVKVYEEKILVIMAGEERPTFLATPISIKPSCFDDKNGKCEDNEGSEKAKNGEKVKEEVGNERH
uniref:Protein GLUTAMINE DUMPER 3 n=1 Tax=Gossypium raimondii TaxID=29730 RepID=A0A0D2LUG2_GOSRA|nr:hypothetical protein B456_001G039700 [Gossypium raimondii]